MKSWGLCGRDIQVTLDAPPLPDRFFEGGFEEAEGRLMLDSGCWRVIVSWLSSRTLPSYICEWNPAEGFVKTDTKEENELLTTSYTRPNK
jgi:hypothetical protein